MANRYFVDGGVDNHWESASNWSLTSGGTGGAGVPIANESAYFDSNSPLTCLIVGTLPYATCLDLNCNGYGGTITITAGKYLHSNGRFFAIGTPSTHLTIQSSIPSSSANFSVDGWVAGTYGPGVYTSSTVDYVVAIDISATGGREIYNYTGTVTRCTKWITNKYFVNGGVDNNYGTDGNWSTTSGGAGGAGVPSIYENAVLDINSPNCTINAGVERHCWNLDCTDYSGTLTAGADIILYGSLIFSVGMTFVPAIYNIVIYQNYYVTKDITTAGKTLYGFLSYADEAYLRDDITCTHYQSSDGTYMLDNTIYVSSIISLWNRDMDLLNRSTFVITSSAVNISGRGWFHNLEIPAGTVVTNSGNINIHGTLNAYGSAVSHVQIKSSTPGVLKPLLFTGELGTFTYVDLLDLTIASSTSRSGKVVYNLAAYGGSVTNCIGMYDTAPYTYHITNYAELQAIKDDPRLDGNYILDNNIDCFGEANFIPIGDFHDTSFRGTFDGQNHTIKNLTVDLSDYSLDTAGGLFGMLGSYSGDWHGGSVAEVRNLILENTTVTTYYAGGALCGFVDGAIVDNVHAINATMNGIEDDDGMSLGGLFGEVYGWMEPNCSSVITNCTASGTINGADFIGGMVGGAWGFNNTSYFKNCSSSTTVNADTFYGYDPEEVGGFVGNSDSYFQDCSATGDINVTVRESGYEVDGVGGFAGYCYNMTNCTATGDINISAVLADTLWGVGGCAGYTYADLFEGCYSTGDITLISNDVSAVGGCIGADYSDRTYGCYATGNITVGGAYSINVGGFSGIYDGYYGVEKCYCEGDVTVNSNTSDYVGGFTGQIGLGGAQNCYSLSNVIGYAAVGGFCGYQWLQGNLLDVYFYTVLKNCYSAGNVTGNNRVGGFAGEAESTIINCFAVGTVTSVMDVGGGFIGFESGTCNIVNCAWDIHNTTNAIGGFGNMTDFLKTAVIDPVNDYAYFGANTLPIHQILRMKLSETTVKVLNVTNTQGSFVSSVIDTTNGFAYFCTQSTSDLTGRIIKINLSTFAVDGNIDLGAAGSVNAAVIDVGDGFAYFGTYRTGNVVKVRLSDFTIVDTLNLSAADYYAGPAVIDTFGGFAYFAGQGAYPAAPKIYKIDLSTFTATSISLTGYGLSCAVIDLTQGFAYFGTDNNTYPSKIHRINLSTFAFSSTLSLSSGYGLFSAVIDTLHGFAYFGHYYNKLTKINLTSFTNVGKVYLNYRTPDSLAIDVTGDRIYIGHNLHPGYITEVKISDFSINGVVFAAERTSVPLLAPGGLGTDETDHTKLYNVILKSPSHLVYHQGLSNAWDFVTPIWYEWSDRYPLFIPEPVAPLPPGGFLTGIYFHTNLSQFIRIYNPNASSRRVYVDGIYWGGSNHRETYYYSNLVPVGSYLDIQPMLGESIIIHNIYYEEGINIRVVIGVNEVDFKDLTA